MADDVKKISITVGQFTGTCITESCKKEFPYEGPAGEDGKPMFPRRVCPECNQRINEQLRHETEREEAAKRNRAAKERWERLCDEDFRVVNPNMPLPVDQLALVMGWEYGPKGLYILGPTGARKSRCMWQLVKKLIWQGRTVEAMTDIEFNNAIGASQGGERMTDMVSRIIAADVFYLDDLGQNKLTRRVAEQLFHVISKRAAKMRPVLITTQMRDVELIEKFAAMEDRGIVSEDKQNLVNADIKTAEAFVRRFADHCRRVCVAKDGKITYDSNNPPPPKPKKNS